MDPYCPECLSFHEAGHCDDIRALRAAVVPCHPDQMHFDDEILVGPKVLCWGCGTQQRLDDLDQDGRCDVCAPRPSLEDVLAESLRQRGVTPR